jgi:hypothetical protein
VAVHSEQQQIYEAIGKRLAEEAPEAWERIEIEYEILEIDDVCEYVIRYAPKRKSGTKQFFVDDTDFHDLFYQLARATSTVEKGLFKRCKYVLFVDGHFSCDFEYG